MLKSMTTQLEEDEMSTVSLKQFKKNMGGSKYCIWTNQKKTSRRIRHGHETKVELLKINVK